MFDSNWLFLFYNSIKIKFAANARPTDKPKTKKKTKTSTTADGVAPIFCFWLAGILEYHSIQKYRNSDPE